MSRRGWLLFCALSVLWGIPYLFIKIAVTDLAPSVVVFGRTALGAALLLPVAAARGALRPLLPQWRWVLLFAAAEIAMPFGMLGYAEQRLSSSLTALLIAAVPLVSAVMARVLGLGDGIDRRRLLGLLVGLAGVGALVGIDVGAGDLLAVGAMGLVVLGYASGPIIVSTRLAALPSLGVTAVALGLNALGYAPFALRQWPGRSGASAAGAAGAGVAGASAVSAGAWWSVVALALLCTVAAFLVFFALVAEVGPARATVITYVNPAVAVLLGVSLLAEPVTVGIVAGFPLVLLGSWLATRRGPRPVPDVAGAPA